MSALPANLFAAPALAAAQDNSVVARALRYLAGLDTDRASTQNGIGYNKIDGEFGHSLARQSLERPLTERQIGYAVKMLMKYNGQLTAAGFDMAELKAAANKPAPTPQAQAQAAAPTNTVAVSTKHPGHLEIRFRYDATLVSQVKSLPGRRFVNDEGGKYWVVPVQLAGYAVRMFKPFNFQIAPEVDALAANQAAPSVPPATAAQQTDIMVPAEEIPGEFIPGGGDTVAVKCAYHPEFVKRLRDLDAAWNGRAREWRIGYDDLAAARAALPWFTVSPELAEKVAKAEAEVKARTERHTARLARYMAETNNLTGPLKHNPAIRLYEHQRDAARFCLTAGKALLAMDMGTGKTLSALAAAKAYADEGMEVIVVCPATLKTNWEREASWVGVPVTVVSWHHNMIPEPPTMWPYVVIGDEVHRAKNPKAQRTQKFMQLAEKAEAVMLLTGTPMVNGRPAELFTMLKTLGHPLAKSKRRYEGRYCQGGWNGYAYEASGASHLDELREKTSNVIFRKRKDECLDLPEKVRVQFDVEITPAAQAVYDQAFAAMVKQYEERKAAGTITGADALAMLTFLRHAAALGTVETVIEGAREIIDEGHQVLMFTNFKDVAAQLAEALGAEVLSGDVPNKDRDPMIQRFQNGERRAMVLTYGAGGVGITLTAASYIYLVDRPWTPGECTQAEDRAHRMGQRNQVTIIWPQAFDVNRQIDAVLLDKQENIDLFLDAGAVDTLAMDQVSNVTAADIAKAVISRIMEGR